MNKEELIKIYSAYLPYGLQISTDDEGENWIETVIGVNNEALETSVGNYWDFTIKPILYDLSYLTKEIEHEGEKFIPIDKINEHSDYGIELEMGSLYWFDKFDLNMLSIHEIFDLHQNLLKWHLNVFNLPTDQFINKATLNK